MPATRLILLRHGETTAEPGRLLGSGVDPSLSILGRAQAAAAGIRVARRHSIGLVVCSPQRRATETAHLAFPGIAVKIDERLREQDFGDLTGLTWEEAKQRYGEHARAWRRGEWTAPGGESHEQLRARVIEAAAAAAIASGAGEVVLVTHHTPIRALIASARGWPESDWRRTRIRWAEHRVVRCPAVDPARCSAIPTVTS